MNSTDTDALGTWFDTVLMPMAAALRAEGRQPFPVAPDVTWLSYYVRRKTSAMTPPDFSAASCTDVAELELRLRAHWQALGRDALAAHCASIGEAARQARAARSVGTADGEVSPYVYAMF